MACTEKVFCFAYLLRTAANYAVVQHSLLQGWGLGLVKQLLSLIQVQPSKQPTTNKPFHWISSPRSGFHQRWTVSLTILDFAIQMSKQFFKPACWDKMSSTICWCRLCFLRCQVSRGPINCMSETTKCWVLSSGILFSGRFQIDTIKPECSQNAVSMRSGCGTWSCLLNSRSAPGAGKAERNWPFERVFAESSYLAVSQVQRLSTLISEAVQFWIWGTGLEWERGRNRASSTGLHGSVETKLGDIILCF